MQIIRDIHKMRAYARRCRLKSRVVGLVPTMGALHEGHLRLVRQSKKECDLTVASIFVNPLQFSQGEDYAVYPRTVEKDLALLKKEKADAVFMPSSAEMCPEGFSAYVEEMDLSKPLCGTYRPGHFRGVTTVVAQLFHLVLPDKAYFGRKDYQQALIIKKMTADLHFPMSVIIVPTARDFDGVALSSRNTYLTTEERMDAEYLHKTLRLARECIEQGERKTGVIVGKMKHLLQSRAGLKIQYAEIRGADDLREMTVIDGSVVIALAVFAGTTRLIDNMLVKVKGNRLIFEL